MVTEPMVPSESLDQVARAPRNPRHRPGARLSRPPESRAAEDEDDKNPALDGADATPTSKSKTRRSKTNGPRARGLREMGTHVGSPKSGCQGPADQRSFCQRMRSSPRTSGTNPATARGRDRIAYPSGISSKAPSGAGL